MKDINNEKDSIKESSETPFSDMIKNMMSDIMIKKIEENIGKKHTEDYYKNYYGYASYIYTTPGFLTKGGTKPITRIRKGKKEKMSKTLEPEVEKVNLEIDYTPEYANPLISVMLSELGVNISSNAVYIVEEIDGKKQKTEVFYEKKINGVVVQQFNEIHAPTKRMYLRPEITDVEKFINHKLRFFIALTYTKDKGYRYIIRKLSGTQKISNSKKKILIQSKSFEIYYPEPEEARLDAIVNVLYTTHQTFCA